MKSSQLNTTFNLEKLQPSSSRKEAPRSKLNTNLDHEKETNEFNDLEMFNPRSGGFKKYGWGNEKRLRNNVGVPGRKVEDWETIEKRRSDDGEEGEDDEKEERFKREERLIFEEQVRSEERVGTRERKRFCLDSSKLEEIEAIGSSPIESCLENR